MSLSRCPRNAIYAYTTLVRHLAPAVDKQRGHVLQRGLSSWYKSLSPPFCCEMLLNLYLIEGVLPIFFFFLLAWHSELFRAFPLDFLHAAPQKASLFR